MSATPPLLEVENATKSFRVASAFGRARTVPALDGVSFSLDEGRTLALVGESGSGKTTCARAVARLIGLDGGHIRFRGRDIAELRGHREGQSYARAVQMIFQDPYAALNPTHTVRHHLLRPIKLHGRLADDTEERIHTLLSTVELNPGEAIGKYPHELSGGERQRVNLARALAVGAELIVADEPTSMLDMSIRRSVLDLMRRLREERGIAFLLITHDIATAGYLADEIAVMFAGRIVERGPSATILSQPGHPYTQLLISARPRPGRRLTQQADGRDFAAMADRVRAMTRDGAGRLVEWRPGHFVAEDAAHAQAVQHPAVETG